MKQILSLSSFAVAGLFLVQSCGSVPPVCDPLTCLSPTPTPAPTTTPPAPEPGNNIDNLEKYAKISDTLPFQVKGLSTQNGYSPYIQLMYLPWYIISPDNFIGTTHQPNFFNAWSPGMFRRTVSSDRSSARLRLEWPVPVIIDQIKIAENPGIINNAYVRDLNDADKNRYGDNAFHQVTGVKVGFENRDNPTYIPDINFYNLAENVTGYANAAEKSGPTQAITAMTISLTNSQGPLAGIGGLALTGRLENPLLDAEGINIAPYAAIVGSPSERYFPNPLDVYIKDAMFKVNDSNLNLPFTPFRGKHINDGTIDGTGKPDHRFYWQSDGAGTNAAIRLKLLKSSCIKAVKIWDLDRVMSREHLGSDFQRTSVPKFTQVKVNFIGTNSSSIFLDKDASDPFVEHAFAEPKENVEDVEFQITGIDSNPNVGISEVEIISCTTTP